MNAVVAHIDEQAVPSRQLTSATPHDLLRMAIERGADLDRLEKLMDLQERWDKEQARKAYVAAMAEFKSSPISIVKDKHVSFTTQKGKTEYDHATIGNVTAQICAALGKHGFSHRWDTEQQEGRIAVTCLITHQLGHSEATTLRASPDDSGGKNNIQAIASTVTYLQRYTLLAATGMATSDQADDDGRGAEPGAFDDWYAAIDGAADMAELTKLGAELKTAGIAAAPLRSIRAAWAKRAKELKA